MITQVLKYFIKSSVDPKWHTLGAAVVIMTARQLFLIQDFTPEGRFIAAVNMLLVIVGSVETFEVAIKPIERKINRGD